MQTGTAHKEARVIVRKGESVKGKNMAGKDDIPLCVMIGFVWFFCSLRRAGARIERIINSFFKPYPGFFLLAAFKQTGRNDHDIGTKQ